MVQSNNAFTTKSGQRWCSISISAIAIRNLLESKRILKVEKFDHRTAVDCHFQIPHIIGEFRGQFFSNILDIQLWLDLLDSHGMIQLIFYNLGLNKAQCIAQASHIPRAESMSTYIDIIVLAHSVPFIASATSKGGLNCVYCFAWHCDWPLTHTFFARKFQVWGRGIKSVSME